MPRRLPSLNALHAFEAAGRLGRMTIAAESLNVTHGAVSRHVRQLEEVLGVKLFEGPKHALRLTEAGQRLLPHLTAAFDTIDAAIRDITDAAEGTLDVSCLGTFTMRWLIPRLHRFNLAHPGIEVRLSASDAPIDFSRQRYAVAIRVTDHAFPPDAIVTELFAEQVGPVLAPVLATRLRLRRPEDLNRACLLHTETRPAAWTMWTGKTRWKPPPSPAAHFEHFYFMLEAAVAGLGVGIAPWPLVSDDVRAGRLIAPFGFRPSGLSYVAVRRTRRDHGAQAFCRWLRREAEQTPVPPASTASTDDA
ncbi:MAG TPA: LysR substrate-binding domain-containing protein [Xanthobacteraceae bacterium]|nr:LysR substrate-binding domain-containing protein [Xanthobacteraceae bacterium]